MQGVCVLFLSHGHLQGLWVSVGCRPTYASQFGQFEAGCMLGGAGAACSHVRPNKNEKQEQHTSRNTQVKYVLPNANLALITPLPPGRLSVQLEESSTSSVHTSIAMHTSTQSTSMSTLVTKESCSDTRRFCCRSFGCGHSHSELYSTCVA